MPTQPVDWRMKVAIAGALACAAVAAQPCKAAEPEGLKGVSREYDDLECRRIQARHGVRVPPGATILQVDGARLPVVLPVRLAESLAPILFLPRGTHRVAFRPGEKPVDVAVASSPSDVYGAMRRFFGVGTAVRQEELLSRSARVMDVHGTPFLLNFSGAGYASAGDWGAAERKFRRALAINPLFPPAHLNLAECLVRRSAHAEAGREIVLAEAFNVGDVFGLAGSIGELRRRLADPRGPALPIDAASLSYGPAEPIREEDRRMVAVLEGASQYAVREEERAKILGNLAVHFAESGRPELALAHFRNALACLRGADPEPRYRLARQMLGQMSDVCRKASFGEADEYRQMSVSLTGVLRTSEQP